MPTMTSARADGRGHWPKGKRRNAGTEDASALLRKAHADGFCWRIIGEAIGVDPKTAWAWAMGRKMPTPKTARKIRRLFPA